MNQLLPHLSDSQPGAQEYLHRILLSPVYDVAVVTPLSTLARLSERLGCEVLLKREDQQPVHSFKLRGAYHKIAGLSADQRAAGVICASAGNHAQGVALSARRLGIKALIVMPRTTPEIKVEAVRQHGGQVLLHGDNFDAAKAEAQRLAESEGYTFVPPFDDADVIAGQGTMGVELLQQVRDLDVLFLPVGGGGLAAGVAVYLKTLRPDIRLVGVESQDSACLAAAWDANAPTPLSHVGLFADGVAVRLIGSETYRVCRACLDEVITVSTDEICAAIKDIFEDTRAIAEPAGAISLAALKKYQQQHQLSGKRLGAILSGANMSFHSLRYISERTELGEGREGVLAVTIPEQKGSFLRFCELLGGRAITEFNYRYADGGEAQIFVGIRLSKGREDRDGLIRDLHLHGYEVHDLSDNELAKLHLRHMVGGRAPAALTESLYSFEFPEAPGALLRFLTGLGGRWNITLFHYRNHGAAYGQVLAGFELTAAEKPQLEAFLHEIGYDWKDESDNLAYRFFLQPFSQNS